LLAALDAATQARIDTANRARVQRAWEVQRATGRSIAAWQDATPAPLLPLAAAQPLVLDADRDWLAARIDQRFDQMVALGALEEARANLPGWDPAHPASKAIGALPLIEHLQGKRDLKDAVATSKTLTRQYAKRQRTWFRSKMSAWRAILLP
jgi:tRNA dimethylallyltransferase